MQTTIFEEIRAYAEELTGSSAQAVVLEKECEFAINGKTDGDKVIEMLKASGSPAALQYVKRLQASKGAATMPTKGTPIKPMLPPTPAQAPVTSAPEAEQYTPDVLDMGEPEASTKDNTANNANTSENNAANPGSSTEPSPETEEAANAAVPESGGESNLVMANLEDLIPHPLIERLYEPDQDALDSLKAEMAANGSRNVPAIIAVRTPNGKLQIIEGLTRRSAACQTGQQKLPTQVIEVKDDCEALIMAVTMQHKRRGNDSKTILKSVSALLPYASDIAQSRQGKNMTSTQHWGEVGKGSSGIIAEIIGVSATTVDKAKKVLEFEDFTKKVMSDEKFSINKAYNEITTCLNGEADKKERKAALKDIGVDGKPAKTDEATEAKVLTAKPATSVHTAQKSVVETTPQSAEPDDSGDPRQNEIESIAQALENFKSEDVWESLKNLPNETLAFLGKRISEKLNESEEAKSNA